MTDEQFAVGAGSKPDPFDAESNPVKIDLPTAKTIRKKGAQPGNANALRHGFYARNLGEFSPRQYKESEMRNLLGEAAMLKDYMYFLYNCNLGSSDSAVLAETLRALALASMALSRILQVHNQVRIVTSNGSSFSGFLDSMNAATARANKLLKR